VPKQGPDSGPLTVNLRMNLMPDSNE
jgi:hypothetical protein